MKYHIKAPNNKYDRTLNGVRFSDGVAETDNMWMAQWFSGRDGFSVEEISEKEIEQPDKKPDPGAQFTETISEKTPRAQSTRTKK
ncbi:MAG: hypothetical protein Q4D42_03010 [Eubacteriales bacterium]|nr:hypothetical protein [Eubacteriales bacterium]